MAVLDCLKAMGGAAKAVQSGGRMKRTSLDAAVTFEKTALSKSMVVPAAIMKAAGEDDIDLELSLHLTTG